MRQEFLASTNEERKDLEEKQKRGLFEWENITPEKQQERLNKLQELAELYHGETLIEKIEKTQEKEWRENLKLAKEISVAIETLGSQALIVGGFVRDEVLGRLGHENIKSKDIDLEVYGLEFDKLYELLKRFGPVEVVGESFGVLKIKNLDVSIPRRDSKIGHGHRDFKIVGDPYMTIKEAARRRDFTFNALSMDPMTGQIIDYYGGVEDLAANLIRATDEKFFADDPLRVLRAAQFAGRFNLRVEEKTKKICQSMELKGLSAERIGEEWKKLLLKSIKPSLGLNTAKELKIIEKLHPEINAIFDVPQDPEWHPEGDVWAHTCMVVDAASQISQENNLSEDKKFVLLLSALLHDLGKATTTEIRSDGHIISHGHAEAGIKPARRFMTSIKVVESTIKKVLPLIKEHLYPTINQEAGESAVRRLSVRLAPATIQELVWLAEADHRGREIEFDGFPQGKRLINKAEQLKVKESKPEPILRGHGDELIKQGMIPGPVFGHILNYVYEMQLEGKVKNLRQAEKKALEMWQKTRQFKSGVRY